MVIWTRRGCGTPLSNPNPFSFSSMFLSKEKQLLVIWHQYCWEGRRRLWTSCHGFMLCVVNQLFVGSNQKQTVIRQLQRQKTLFPTFLIFSETTLDKYSNVLEYCIIFRVHSTKKKYLYSIGHFIMFNIWPFGKVFWNQSVLNFNRFVGVISVKTIKNY